MKIRITGTPAKKRTRTLEEAELSIEQLTALLTVHEVGEKDGPAIIPAVFRPCPEVCHNHGKKKFVDCGGGQRHRLALNVAAMTCFGADLDDVPEPAFAEMIRGLQAKGLRFWVWNTHGHVEGSGQVRARILIPFDRPLELVSAKQWSAGAWPNLVKWLGLDGAARADTACKDPGRVYYLPRKPSEESKHEAAYADGEALNWRAVLGDSLAGFAAPAALVPAAIAEDPSRPVDLEDYRERLRSIQKKKTKALISNALAGKALTPAPEQRRPGEPSRYEAWRHLTGAMAAQAEDWESSKALLSVVRDAHTAEARESPHDFTEWETIEHLFDTARAGIPQVRAQYAAEREAKRQMFQRIGREHAQRRADALAARAAGQISDSRPPSVEARGDPNPKTPSDADPSPSTEGEEGPAPEGFDWTEGLQRKEDADGNSTVESCASNVEWVLRHHPAWKGTLRLNLFTREVEVHGGPVGVPGKVQALHDNHAGLVADWLSRDTWLNFRIKDHVVWSRMLIVAESNGYDPLQDYLNSVHARWDGAERLDGAAVKYFGASAVDGLGRDITGYLGFIFRRWMISAVARGLSPGEKVDTVLHLEGDQGAMKSSALRILGGQFFSETAIDVHSKDSWAACGTNWIIELGEQETFKRSEVSAQKRFFALLEDQYRPPYGRSAVKVPRRCVFASTTNPDEYLTDPTGNRRHWPMAVGRIDLAALREDRDQLWAEAVVRYRRGEQWHLTREEEEIQRQQVLLRMAGDPLEEAILKWWGDRAPGQRPTEVSILDVCKQVLEEKPARGLETRIGNALRVLGFQRKRRVIAGKPQRYYVPTEELLNMQRPGPAPSPTRVIAQARSITVINPVGSNGG